MSLLQSEKRRWLRQLSKVMPPNSARGFRKFENLILGLIVGADCLDDMENLHTEPGFSALCDNRDYVPKSYGDLLRQFTQYHCKLANYELIDLAYAMHSHLSLKQESITIDIDSTVIRQHGKKMEGVRKNPHGYCVLIPLQLAAIVIRSVWKKNFQIWGRWKVERFFAWLNNYRRVVVRLEFKS